MVTAALGAAGMYFFDSRSGRRRRALAKDAFEHFTHASIRGLDVGMRDLWHRAHGRVAALRGVPQRLPDDDVLAERVRTKLGRLCSNPHAIEVVAERGKITLEGPVLADEAARVIVGVRSIPGVLSLEDRLDRHERRDVPALQGTPRVWQARTLPAYWPPAARLVIGGAATALVAYGVVRRGVIGAAAAMVGGAALARSVTNLELGALVGVLPRGVTITKSVAIDAPLGDVFAYFTAFEKFPLFMRSVIEVKEVGENRWHWKVRGPAGVPFEWDAVVMEFVPGQFLSWTSTESAAVRHTGNARFEKVDGGTRMTIRVTYEPPLGILGHELARLFGVDPKRDLDGDMLRFKSLLEHGRATGRNGTVTRDELRVTH
jgi:uncharacterized membrane protein